MDEIRSDCLISDHYTCYGQTYRYKSPCKGSGVIIKAVVLIYSANYNCHLVAARY